jgi:DNA-binding CsgD family transcriptional regulator
MAGFEALNLLNIGLVVIDSDSRLLMANGAAQQLLEQRDGIEVTAERIFQAVPGCGPGLSAALLEAARHGSVKSAREDAVIAVQRPSGKRPLTLLVRAVKRARRERQPGNAPAVLVFILDPQLPVEAAEVELRQLYELTSSEARLANLLMEGKTLDACCDQLGIRRSTGRTHLQHLFEKVGVQRQSELVSILLKSIGLIRIGNKDRRRKGGILD